MHPAKGDQKTTNPSSTGSPAGAYQATVITASAGLMLMLADMAAPTAFVPAQLRGMVLAAVVMTLAVYLDRRREVAAARRHRELMDAIREQAQGTEYVRGYVDGLERRPADLDAGRP